MTARGARRLAAVALTLACAVPTRAETERPDALRGVGIEQRLGSQLPLDTPFRDEQGRPVRLGDYFGERPVLLVPAYYECPMLCTLVLNGVVSALRAVPFDIGQQFEVVTFSFDPRETPEQARAKKEHYLGQYRRLGAERGWHFLTGDEPAIRTLTEALGYRYAWDEQTQQYAHASGVVIATPSGRIHRVFFGVEFAPRDLRFAFVEAAEHKIGSLVDTLLLFCFHYDPATGRYSTAVLNAIRLGGVATLLLLGTFIVRTTRTV